MKKAITFIAIAGLSMGRIFYPPGCKPGSKLPECKPIAPWEWKYTTTMYPKAATAADDDNELFHPASIQRKKTKSFDDDDDDDDDELYLPRDYPKYPSRPGVLYARHQPTVLKHEKTTEKTNKTPVLKEKALDQLKTLIADDEDDNEFIVRKNPGKFGRGGLASRVALDDGEDNEFAVKKPGKPIKGGPIHPFGFDDEEDNEFIVRKNPGKVGRGGLASRVALDEEEDNELCFKSPHTPGKKTPRPINNGPFKASDIKKITKKPDAKIIHRADFDDEEEELFLDALFVDEELRVAYGAKDVKFEKPAFLANKPSHYAWAY